MLVQGAPRLRIPGLCIGGAPHGNGNSIYNKQNLWILTIFFIIYWVSVSAWCSASAKSRNHLNPFNSTLIGMCGICCIWRTMNDAQFSGPRRTHESDALSYEHGVPNSTSRRLRCIITKTDFQIAFTHSKRHGWRCLFLGRDWQANTKKRVD